MQFNSLQFLIFFPIVLLLYYVLPVIFFQQGAYRFQVRSVRFLFSTAWIFRQGRAGGQTGDHSVDWLCRRII